MSSVIPMSGAQMGDFQIFRKGERAAADQNPQPAGILVLFRFGGDFPRIRGHTVSGRAPFRKAMQAPSKPEAVPSAADTLPPSHSPVGGTGVP